MIIYFGDRLWISGMFSLWFGWFLSIITRVCKLIQDYL